MKKITILFVSVLSLGLALTSCSKDDDSSSDGGSTTAAIEGKWAFSKEGAIVSGNEVLVDYAHECSTKKDYVELVAGGTVNDVYYPSDCVADVTTGTWTKSGNNVTITAGGFTQTAEIVILNATTLKVKYTESGMTMLQVYTRQ